MARRESTVYPPAERPDVEVVVDEEWLVGEARMRWIDDSSIWWYQVAWRPKGTHTRRLDSFPAHLVRPDQSVRGPAASPRE